MRVAKPLGLTHHVAIIYKYFPSKVTGVPFEALMITSSLKLLARLPLSWFHRAGVAVGWLMYWGSPTYAKRVKENLSASGICSSERQYRADQGNRPGNRKNGDRAGQSLVRV